MGSDTWRRPEALASLTRPAFVFLGLATPVWGAASTPGGEGPALGDERITQDEIVSGQLTLDDVRAAGLKIFATPFNRLDGYGDGPSDPANPVVPGHRPTLQGNGTFLRINGLDAQTCMECHSVGSNATVPFTFAVGGVGGANNNALFQPTEIDVDDSLGNGFAAYDGRFINPPFLFGSGGVELVAREMTAQLLSTAALAQATPGVFVDLTANGVAFGSVAFDDASGRFDTTRVVGVDADLVIRPFGRKGEFATVRGFDLEALPFHMGMQPVETTGAGVDGDDDGILDEVLIGEVSALHIFNTNLEAPRVDFGAPGLVQGFVNFGQAGCAVCHVPAMVTTTPELTYSFPENPLDPVEGLYFDTDLVAGPASFPPAPSGGASVRMFSDFKRHDMGPELAESFGSELDSSFLTARLWGVADTAPYLHDGRALTLTEAIEMHGGEALAARDAFLAASEQQKEDLLSFLRALRTPTGPAADLLGE